MSEPPLTAGRVAHSGAALPLLGKAALVTGSSRGIGKAIAFALAQRGADVAVNYVTQQHAAQEVVDHVRVMERHAFAVRADVSRPEDLDRLFNAVGEQWGSLDIYVNNAIDVASYGPTMKLKPDAWRHTIDSHVTTFLIASQRAARLMKGRRGVIVALSSLGSRSYVPGYAAIGVGKAAIEALTRYLAAELGPEGIRVNSVSAGPIDTDALRLYPNYERIKDACVRQLPARRMGEVDDVAEVVAFLCTEGARWICGQTLVVDGGLSLLSAQPA